MGRLELNLLGTPEIVHDGLPCSFRTRKALALLVYLVIESGMQSREKLATVFWPESDHKAGRATLRSTLRFLRSELEHRDDQTVPHLLVERNALGFNPASDYELDLDVMEAAVGARRTAPLQEAVDVYRGGFLEGFGLPDAPAFDEWAGFQREYWHRRMNEVFDRLSQMQSDAGEIAAAIETVTQWRSLAPLQERAYRRLMRLQFLGGDRAAALQSYEQCRTMLAEELGIEPAPETEALAERIRHDAPPQRERGLVGEGHVSAGTRRTLSGDDLPLVGRGEQHRRLATVYRQVLRGQFRAATVEGTAGIGKSRLVHEFLDWTRAREAMVAEARAFETGGRLPYQPIIDLLRRLLHEVASPTDLLSDVWLAEVSRLLPELRDRHPDLPAPRGEETTAQTRLFEAVQQLGTVLAERRPLVLFIDDLQWADTASLDLLHYTGRRWMEAGAPIFLVVGMRSEDLARGARPPQAQALREWLNGLERDVPLARIVLSALSQGDTRELVRRLVGAEGQGSRGAEVQGSGGAQELGSNRDVSSRAPKHPGSSAPDHPSTSAQFADWLYAETQGHPFYIGETLKTLLEEGLLVRRRTENGGMGLAVPEMEEGASWAPPEELIPPGIRDVVRSRLANLPTDAFEVLSAGAVLGHDFDFRALCAVSDVAPAEALPALEDLEACHLLVETAETNERGSNLYRFTHDKIRDVAYTEMGDARRQVFHTRALDYLEDEERGTPTERAHHAYAAGRTQAAFRYSLAAGDAAMELFAVHDAMEQYETARRLLTTHSRLDVEPERRRHLYEQLGRAYELVNAWEDARTVYRELLAVARDANVASLQVTAYSHLANLAIQERLNVTTAIDHLEQARDIAERAGDRAGLARTEWSLSQAAYYAFDRERAITHGERALALAREIGDDALIARCLNALAYAKEGAVPTEQLDAAQKHARVAADRFAALGDRAMQADSLNVMAVARINAGRPRDAMQPATRAREIACEIDNVWGQANTGFVLAQSHFECGEYGAALDLIDDAVATARAHELATMLAGILSVRGTMYRMLESPAKARLDHKEANTYFSYLENPHVLRATAIELGAAHAAAGDWETAYEYLREGVPVPGRSWMFSSVDYWRLIEALLRGGEIDRARAAADRFGERIGDNPRYAIPYRRSLALLAIHEGRLDTALTHLEAAAGLAADLNLPGDRWRTLAALARLHDELGRPSEAAPARMRAQKIVERLAETLSDETIREQFVAGAQAQLPAI